MLNNIVLLPRKFDFKKSLSHSLQYEWKFIIIVINSDWIFNHLVDVFFSRQIQWMQKIPPKLSEVKYLLNSGLMTAIQTTAECFRRLMRLKWSLIPINLVFLSSSPRPFCCIVSSLLNVINVIFLTTQQMIIFYKPDTEKHMKPSSEKAEKSALHESCCFCSMLWYYYISFIMVYQQAMDDEHEQYLWLVTAVRYRGRVNMLIWISQ